MILAKTFRAAATVALLCLAAVGFGSCGSDDDENGGSAAGYVEDQDGNAVRITGVGSYGFIYNDEGELTTVTVNGKDSYEITQNPFTITPIGNGGDPKVEYTISLNGSGYITKLVKNYQSGNTSDGMIKVTTSTFSYNGSGHLTKYTEDYKKTYYDERETSTSEESSVTVLEWKDNKLVTSTVTETYEDGDEEAETISYEYGDNEYPNLAHQLSVGCEPDVELKFLAYIGMFGKGGDYLPVSSCELQYAGGKVDHDDETTFSYGFNFDGTIDYVKSGVRIYKYSYASSIAK